MHCREKRGTAPFVYTEKDDDGNLFGETEVTTGLSDGSTVEITDGLEEGTTVYYLRSESSSSGAVQICRICRCRITDEISGMGSSYLTVTISDDKENPLKLSEISGFAEPDEVDAAAPMARTSVTAKSGYTSESMTLIGTTGSYLDIQQMEIQYGRFIKNADVENNTNVVVLTYDTAVELLGRADVEGEKISLNGKSFLVIGVLTEDSSSSLTKGQI